MARIEASSESTIGALEMNFNRGGRDSQRVNEKDLATELRQIIGEENVLTDSYSRGNKRVIKIPAREFVDRRRNKSSQFPDC